jgi:hypothetical protein
MNSNPPMHLEPSVANLSSTNAKPTVSTLHGDITYSAAVDEERNMLNQLSYWEKREEFVGYLLKHTAEIEAIVSYYLRLKGSETCRLSSYDQWMHGSFNICLPVYVDNWKRRPGRRVIIRFPLPFKIGESNFPGNADEKIRCEAATYAWIQENCPDVHIPYLWGFSLCDGPSVSIDKHDMDNTNSYACNLSH